MGGNGLIASPGGSPRPQAWPGRGLAKLSSNTPYFLNQACIVIQRVLRHVGAITLPVIGEESMAAPG